MRILTYIGLLCLACLIVGSASAAFCGRVETGSSMWLTAGSISTEMGTRFITADARDGTETYNNVLVTEYAPGIPAHGTVSAFIKGKILEDGQVVEFDDTTSVSGEISTFSKNMYYSVSGSGTSLPGCF